MISKQMCKILKTIPHAPTTSTFKDIENKHLMDINLLKNLLKDAQNNKYIAFEFSSSPYNDILRNKFFLTELGQIAIEEYKRQKNSAKKSTWAIIISGLSFLTSVAAIIVSCIA